MFTQKCWICRPRGLVCVCSKNKQFNNMTFMYFWICRLTIIYPMDLIKHKLYFMDCESLSQMSYEPVLQWEWRIMCRQAMNLDNCCKLYQMIRESCKSVVWFYHLSKCIYRRVLARRRQQPKFCACALQKQLVWVSHLNVWKSCDCLPIDS